MGARHRSGVGSLPGRTTTIGPVTAPRAAPFADPKTNPDRPPLGVDSGCWRLLPLPRFDVTGIQNSNLVGQASHGVKFGVASDNRAHGRDELVA